MFVFAQSSITCDRDITPISPTNSIPMIKVTLQSSLTYDRDITRISPLNSIPMIKVTLQDIIITQDYWAWIEKY